MTAQPAPLAIDAVVTHAELPSGILGPDPVPIEVRSFVVRTADTLVLIDTGMPGTAGAIEESLRRFGADWTDVSDVVLTHAHFDHVGGLRDVAVRAPTAMIWAGALDVVAIVEESGLLVRPVSEGDRIRDLHVLETPGHTAGHISMLHEADSTVFVGDLVGSIDGSLSLGPPAFTADHARSRAALARVAGLGVRRLLFSHGAEIADASNRIRRFLDAVDPPD